MKFGVVMFPGSNCDHDALHVTRDLLGADVDVIDALGIMLYIANVHSFCAPNCIPQSPTPIDSGSTNTPAPTVCVTPTVRPSVGPTRTPRP